MNAKNTTLILAVATVMGVTPVRAVLPVLVDLV